ncbi:hypothetical protein [Saccharopolyspora taberi]|uniref:Uncharacterized protein n=1 Tax=Saccharopolyspora taberi TaxID=60895 RepID=A0ABN3V1V5_9PSEU
MEALLLLAMVLSAAVTHAIDKSKIRSKAVYDEYRQRAQDRAAAREKAREEAAQAWEQRLQDARSTGPRAPLWWAYSGGMVIAGTAAAVVAGATGALTGLVQGAAGGWIVGREGGRQGWSFVERWAEWRRRHPRTPIEMQQCARCGGYTSEQLIEVAPYGRVCNDCVPAATPEPPPKPTDDEPEDIVHERPGQPHSSSDEKPRCARGCGRAADEGSTVCPVCFFAEEIRKERAKRPDSWWDETAERPCPACNGQGKVIIGGHLVRCQECRGWGVYPTPDGTPPPSCNGKCSNSNLDPTEAMKRGLCPDCGGLGELITNFGGEHRHVPCGKCKGSGGYSGPPPREQNEKPETIRVTAERVYPDQKETEPKGIENTMTALEPATSQNIDDSGEGYSSTVASLEGLANLMKQVHEKVTNLNESLTANSMDIDTLSKLSDMTDEIESVAEKAADLHRHVSDRHGGLATATAEAGGSQNVATKTFYDDI